jgi:glycosyltransferase involved in cell wall biosynthesis
MLIEAFACGVPVVASDRGEIPLVVGEAGVIVAERDNDGWRRELSRVLGDPALRADLAARGRARAVSTFSWPIVARQHSEFFSQVIDGRAEAVS